MKKLKTQPMDKRPITVKLPAFALFALSDKATNWASKFEVGGEAHTNWTEVAEAFYKAGCTANATKEA